MRVVVCLLIAVGQAAGEPPSVRKEIRKSPLLSALSRQPLELDKREPRVEIGDWKFPLPKLSPPAVPEAQLRSATEVVATGPDDVVVSDPFERPIPPTPRRDPGWQEPENVGAVMRRNVRALIRCYESALRVDPAMQGSLRIALHVDGTGAVTRVELAASSGNLDAGLVACLTQAMQRWRLPPSGNEYDLQLPLTFATR